MDKSIEFFHARFSEAFPSAHSSGSYPGVFGAARLAALLRAPLRFGELRDLVWWWRGHSNLHIETFRLLSDDKALMDVHELKIARVIPLKSTDPAKECVYVETTGEPPTGVTLNLSEIGFDAEIGYQVEEYALLNERPITRSEYDNGEAWIDGTLSSISGAQLRLRYVSPFNFLIAPQRSKINNHAFDQPLLSMLNGILAKAVSIESLAKAVAKL